MPSRVQTTICLATIPTKRPSDRSGHGRLALTNPEFLTGRDWIVVTLQETATD